MTTYSQTLGAGVELPAGAAQLARGDNPIVTWDPAAALEGAAKMFGYIALDAIVEVVNIALDQLEGEKGMPASRCWSRTTGSIT